MAEVEVNRKTGRVRVTRLFAAAELGTTLVNPDGVKNQLEGGSIMGLSRSLKEETRFSRRGVRSFDWVSYPILRFVEIPETLDLVVLTSPPSIPGGGIGEPASIAVPPRSATRSSTRPASGCARSRSRPRGCEPQSRQPGSRRLVEQFAYEWGPATGPTQR